MYDRVLAYDGLTTDAPQLGRYCGSRKPAPIISTQSTLLLTFNADGSVQRKGFRAQHSTGKLQPYLKINHTGVLNVVCFFVLSLRRGTEGRCHPTESLLPCQIRGFGLPSEPAVLLDYPFEPQELHHPHSVPVL